MERGVLKADKFAGAIHIPREEVERIERETARWKTGRGFASCVARDLEGCDHDCPRWDMHTPRALQLPPCCAHPASLIRSEFPQSTWLRPFALPHPDGRLTNEWETALYARRRRKGRLAFPLKNLILK